MSLSEQQGRMDYMCTLLLQGTFSSLKKGFHQCRKLLPVMVPHTEGKIRNCSISGATEDVRIHVRKQL